MTRRVQLLGVLLAVLALPGAARAQTFTFYNICGYDGPLYMGCASAEALWTGNNLQLRIWNMEGNGNADQISVFGSAHTITSIGLTYLGADAATRAPMTVGSWSASYGGTDVSSYWRSRDPLQLSLAQGNKGGIVGCTDPGTAASVHVSTCGAYPTAPYVQFSFNDVGGLGSPAELAFDFSSKQTGGATGSLDASSAPEPATILLLGTGLAAIGLARRRRRGGADPV